MLAGLQGSGKTTLAGKLAQVAARPGPYAAAGGLRPAAARRGQPAADRRRARRRRGVRAASRARRPAATRSAAGPGDPVAVAAAGLAEAKAKHYDVVIVDTAGRLGIDEELMAQAARDPRRRQPRRGAVRPRRDDRPGRRHHRRGVPRGRRLHRRGADQARRRRPRWRRAVGARGHRRADPVRVQRREARGLRRLPPRPDGQPHPRHGRRADA